MKKRFVVFLHLIPAGISLLLIGAHFLRTGNLLVPLLSLLLIMALCVREPFIARTVQVVLVLATAEWIHLIFTLVSARLEAGLPWTKLVLILGGVAALALVSIGLFWAKALKEMYHLSLDPGTSLPNRVATPEQARPRPRQPEPAVVTERRQKLLAVYKLKVTLTTCSLLCFLLMDYSLGLGMIALIAIGLINSALRTKMQRIGGILPSAERKRLYLRQTLGLGLFALPMIGYYAILLPASKQPLIVGSVIAAFTLLLWAAARYEYLHMGQEG